MYDAAVSGRKKHREGLLEMKAALSQRHLKVLIVFSTNRLYRKGYALEQFVEEEVTCVVESEAVIIQLASDLSGR